MLTSYRNGQDLDASQQPSDCLFIHCFTHVRVPANFVLYLKQVSKKLLVWKRNLTHIPMHSTLINTLYIKYCRGQTEQRKNSLGIEERMKRMEETWSNLEKVKTEVTVKGRDQRCRRRLKSTNMKQKKRMDKSKEERGECLCHRDSTVSPRGDLKLYNYHDNNITLWLFTSKNLSEGCVLVCLWDLQFQIICF